MKSHAHASGGSGSRMTSARRVVSALPALLLHTSSLCSASDVTPTPRSHVARHQALAATTVQSLRNVTSQFAKSFVTSEAIKSRQQQQQSSDAAAKTLLHSPHALYRPDALADVTHVLLGDAHATPPSALDAYNHNTHYDVDTLENVTDFK